MKKVSEMSKDEFVEYRAKEKQTDKTEVLELWEKFEKEFTEKGCTGTELSDRVKRRIQSYYIQVDKNPSEDFEGIIIGVSENDFGARKQFATAKKAFKENPQKTIADGLVDANGNPIKQSGIDKGSIIDVEKSLQRTYYGIFKGKDNNFIKGVLVCKSNYFSKIPAFFSLLKFRAIKNQKSTPENYVLSVSAVTDFKTIKELSYEESETALKQYYPESLLSIGRLKEYVEANANNFDRMAIVKGDIYQLVDEARTKVDDATGKTVLKNVMIGLNKDDDAVVGYGSPNFPLRLRSDAQDVILIGQPRKNAKTEEITMVIYGVLAPKKFRQDAVKYIEPVAKTEPPKADEAW